MTKHYCDRCKREMQDASAYSPGDANFRHGFATAEFVTSDGLLKIRVSLAKTPYPHHLCEACFQTLAGEALQNGLSHHDADDPVGPN